MLYIFHLYFYLYLWFFQEEDIQRKDGVVLEAKIYTYANKMTMSRWNLFYNTFSWRILCQTLL